MPIRGSPNGANHLRPQAGRDRLEQVVAINRNAWSQSIGTAGRNHPVRAAVPPPMLLARADGDRVMRFLLRCMSPLVADFVAKVFLHS